MWIGGNDIEIEGQYVWVTGEPITWTYWGQGQPSLGGGSNDCIQFRRFSDVQSEWNDRDCDILLRFVCEGILLFSI